MGTDGASVMRSTREFAGLDCRGTIGRSFSARVKRDIKDDIDFWHCLAHQFNLALNDALDAIEPLKLFYIPHLRMCHSEFKRSSKNRAELKSIREELREFDRHFTYVIFYPALFCLTRWIGVHRCASILARRPIRVLLNRYAQRLRTMKMGPRPFDPFKYRQRRRRAEEADAGGDDLEGDANGSDDEDEIRELRRVRDAIENGRLEEDGYQPQRELFTSVEDAKRSAPTQRDLVAADDFDEGREGAGGRKRKNMLNKNVGLTDLNFGRSCYMSGCLKPYKVLIEQLQRTDQPEQHLAAR